MKRDQLGRWLPGESANPNGGKLVTPARRRALERIKRANEARRRAQQNVESRFQQVVAQVSEATIQNALSGDAASQRLVLERVDPPRRPESPPVVVKDFDRDVETASASVCSMVASGQISVEKGQALLEILSKRAELSFAASVVNELMRLRGNLQRHGLEKMVPALAALEVSQ